jgi:hypothetical protein
MRDSGRGSEGKKQITEGGSMTQRLLLKNARPIDSIANQP